MTVHVVFHVFMEWLVSVDHLGFVGGVRLVGAVMGLRALCSDFWAHLTVGLAFHVLPELMPAGLAGAVHRLGNERRAHFKRLF